MSRSSVKNLVRESLSKGRNVSLEEELNKVEDTVNEDVTLIEQDLNAAFEYSDELNADLDCVSSFHSTVNKADIEEKGIDQSSVEIMNEAIEGICRRHGLGLHRKLRVIDTSTKEGRIRQGKIALEGIGDIVDWIIERLKAMWKAIQDFFGKLFGSEEDLYIRKFNALYEKAKQVYDKKDEFTNEGMMSDNNKFSYLEESANGKEHVKAFFLSKADKRWPNGDSNGIAVDDALSMVEQEKSGVILLVSDASSVHTKVMTAAVGANILAVADAFNLAKGKEERDAYSIYRSQAKAIIKNDDYINYVLDKEAFKDKLPESISTGLFDPKSVEKLYNVIKDIKNKISSDNQKKVIEMLKEREKKITEEVSKKAQELGDAEEAKAKLEEFKKGSQMALKIFKGIFHFVNDYADCCEFLVSSANNQLKSVREGAKKS